MPANVGVFELADPYARIVALEARILVLEAHVQALIGSVNGLVAYVHQQVQEQAGIQGFRH